MPKNLRNPSFSFKKLKKRKREEEEHRRLLRWGTAAYSVLEEEKRLGD